MHHVIIHRIQRKAIYKEDIDRDEFLERIELNVTDSSTPCFAWASMTHHVYLQILNAEPPIQKMTIRPSGRLLRHYFTFEVTVYFSME